MDVGNRRYGRGLLASGIVLWVVSSAVSVGCTQRGTSDVDGVVGTADCPEGGTAVDGMRLESIGVVRSPYTDEAPFQPLADDQGDFRLVLEPQYESALKDVTTFKYIYVLYHLNQQDGPPENLVHPPWAPEGTEVGLFAARSPHRPSPIGLSVVGVKRVEGSTVFTTGLDAFDGTPILDIKPYIKGLDTRADANAGWIDDLPKADEIKSCLAGSPPAQ